MNSAAMTDPEATTRDAFLGGRLLLRQPKRGHRAGHDAMVLADATEAQSGDRVVEFGAGIGAAGLALASRVAGLALTLVEIDPALAVLAEENATANALPARVVVLDVEAPAAAFTTAGLGPDSTDVVLMNPPFNTAGRHQRSPDEARGLAHQATGTTLENWVHAARRILRPGGAVTLIWRADGLDAVLAALSKGLGSMRVVPVYPDAASPAIRIVVTAVKGGRAPLMVLPGRVLARGANPSAED